MLYSCKHMVAFRYCGLQCASVCVPMVLNWCDTSQFAVWTACVVISNYIRARHVCGFAALL